MNHLTLLICSQFHIIQKNKTKTTKTNEGDTVPSHYLPSKQLNFTYMQSSRSHIFHFLFVSYMLPSYFIDKFLVILYVYLFENIPFRLAWKNDNLMDISFLMTVVVCFSILYFYCSFLHEDNDFQICPSQWDNFWRRTRFSSENVY